MAIRTDTNKVRDAIPVRAGYDLTSVIRTANVITNRVQANDTGGVLTGDDLIEIETYVAAHLYSLEDAQYLEKATESASGVFIARDWLAVAKLIDVTGTLAAMAQGLGTIGITWLGKTQGEKIEWQDRN